MLSWPGRAKKNSNDVDAAIDATNVDIDSTNRVARQTGLNPAQLLALRQAAIEGETFYVARPANPVTDVTAIVAQIMGLIVALKPMAMKAKSGNMGGAMFSAMFSAMLAAEAEATSPTTLEEIQRHNLMIQKSAALDYEPAICSLDILLALQHINRLGNPHLEVTTTTIRSSTDDRSEERVSYHIVFPFMSEFASSKTSAISVQIPSSWVHPGIRSNPEDSQTRMPKLVKLEELEVTTDRFEHDLEQVNNTQRYLEEVAAGKHGSEVSLSQHPPPAIFALHKGDLIDAEGNPIDKEQSIPEWRKAFTSCGRLSELLNPDLLSLPPERSSRPRPATLSSRPTKTPPSKKTYLRESIQSVWLPVHAATARGASSRPWPAAFGIKRGLLIPKPGQPPESVDAMVASDLDLAAVAHPTKPDTTVGDLAELSDGTVTGVGLADDATAIQALNAAYFEQATELGRAPDLEGSLYRRQVAAGILTAHHGAENMNPYATVESTREAMKEGFLFVAPDGNMQFLQREDQIYDFFSAYCGGKKGKHYLPMSAVWYQIFEEEAAKEGQTLSDHFIKVDVSAFGPKPAELPTDPFAAQAAAKAAVATLKAKAIDKMNEGIFLRWSCATVKDEDAEGLEEALDRHLVDRLLIGPQALTNEVLFWIEAGRKVSLPSAWHAVVLDTLGEDRLSPEERNLIVKKPEATTLHVAGLAIDPKNKRRLSSQSRRSEGAAAAASAASAAASASADESLEAAVGIATGAEARPSISGALIRTILTRIAAADYPEYEDSDAETFAEFTASMLGVTFESADEVTQDYYAIRSDIDSDAAIASFDEWHTIVTDNAAQATAAQASISGASIRTILACIESGSYSTHDAGDAALFAGLTAGMLGVTFASSDDVTATDYAIRDGLGVEDTIEKFEQWLATVSDRTAQAATTGDGDEAETPKVEQPAAAALVLAPQSSPEPVSDLVAALQYLHDKANGTSENLAAFKSLLTRFVPESDANALSYEHATWPSEPAAQSQAQACIEEWYQWASQPVEEEEASAATA